MDSGYRSSPVCRTKSKPRKHGVCEVFSCPKSRFGLYFGPYLGKSVVGSPVYIAPTDFSWCVVCALSCFFPLNDIRYDIARSALALREVMAVSCHKYQIKYQRNIKMQWLVRYSPILLSMELYLRETTLIRRLPTAKT